jgi:hypothetical protein
MAGDWCGAARRRYGIGLTRPVPRSAALSGLLLEEPTREPLSAPAKVGGLRRRQILEGGGLCSRDPARAVRSPERCLVACRTRPESTRAPQQTPLSTHVPRSRLQAYERKPRAIDFLQQGHR